MTEFLFPLYSRIARAENEPRLLVVGRIFNFDKQERQYTVIDSDGVRDWVNAEVLERDFIIVED